MKKKRAKRLERKPSSSTRKPLVDANVAPLTRAQARGLREVLRGFAGATVETLSREGM